MNEKIIQIIDFLKEELLSIDAWEKALFTTSITQNDSISFDLTLFKKGEDGKRYLFDNLFKTRDIILKLKKKLLIKSGIKHFLLFIQMESMKVSSFGMRSFI